MFETSNLFLDLSNLEKYLCTRIQNSEGMHSYCLISKFFKMETKKSIEERIEELENLIYLSKNVLSFEESSRFLNLSKSYLYKLTSAGVIPHYKPQGKMIYFEKTALEEWLRQNPVKTQEQIAQEAQRYLLTHK